MLIFFIIICIFLNCFNNLFTSCISTPEPFAILFFLDPLIILGFLFSFLVIELIIALILRKVLSSKFDFSKAFLAFLTPGINDKIPFIPPIFFICCNCLLKSSKSKLPLDIFSAIASASFSSNSCSAFSTIPTMSPISNILSANLLAEKTSISCIFSPTPKYLIGFPIVFVILKAAPPFESPSTLVNMVPVISTYSKNAFATLIDSCPIMASVTNKVSAGIVRFLISFSSCNSFSSTFVLPEVSKMITSLTFFLASSKVFFINFSIFSSDLLSIKSTFIAFANLLSCSIAAGLEISSEETITFFFFCFNKLANFAAVVVLPLPCKPTINITDGTFFIANSKSLSSKLHESNLIKLS